MREPGVQKQVNYPSLLNWQVAKLGLAYSGSRVYALSYYALLTTMKQCHLP